MRKQTKLWTTKDGQRVRICDMADSHLVNTIRMLRRYHNALVLSAYSAANMMQGEMAQMCMDQEIDRLEDGDIEMVHDLGENLLWDAWRRGMSI